MRTVVYDIEANGLQPDRIWCVVAKDVSTNEVFTFLEGDRNKFSKFTEEVERFIGHNIIQYDNYWIGKLWGIDIPTSKSYDTLVLSRMFNPCEEKRVRLPNGKWKSTVVQKRNKNQHSLRYWGTYLNNGELLKGDHEDFSKFSQEMLDYCIQDVNLNHRVWNYLKENESRGFSKQSIKLEHQLQEILCQQMRNGFKLNVPKAKELLQECTSKCLELEEAMQKDFPPLPQLKKTYYPRLNKDGTTHNQASLGPMKLEYGFQYHGEPYSAIEWVDFNLSSPTQVLRRLEGHWDPVEFTEKGQARLSDINIATIKDTAPESIKNIKLYRMYTSRCNELTQWISGAERYGDGRIHGNITHLGSWSGRASHNHPNTANIAGVQHDHVTGKVLMGEAGAYGYECRSLWTVEAGNVLLGCDASGIQLRILAHYLNNEEFTKSVLSPKPNDIHTKNANILGCDRDTAKTFIYSWLLGAGVAMTAQILGCSEKEAIEARERFVQLTPGLGEFLKRKTIYASRGWYKGLDGRKVYIPSDHLALTAFLQNGEHVIMALSDIYWNMWAKQRGIWFKQVNYVHDEWEVETKPEHAEEMIYLMEQSFVRAGEYLKLNCPLTGEGHIGLTWADVH